MADPTLDAPPSPVCPLDAQLDATLRNSAQRSQLNPLEIAEALEKLNGAGWTEKRIKDTYQISIPSQRQYLPLLELPAPVQEVVRDKRLTFSLARELCKLLANHPTQIEAACEKILQEGMSQREAEPYIRDLMKGTPAPNTATTQPHTEIHAHTSVTQPERVSATSGAEVPAPNIATTRSNTEKHAYNAVTQPGTPRGTPGLAEVVGESFLWQGLYSVPVVWRAIPWLRTQVYGMKASPEKRRIWVGWLLAGLALWFFWPRIWPVVKGWRYPALSRPSSGSAPTAGTASGTTGAVPVPELAVPVLGAGHKIEMHWTNLGPGYRYHVYFSCGSNPADMSEMYGARPVSGPGALVDIPYAYCRDGGFVAVMAESSNHLMSDLSAARGFNGLNPANQNYSVEELPTPKQDLGGGGSSQTNAPSNPNSKIQNRQSEAVPRHDNAPPAPTELHAEVRSPDIIVLSWRAVGSNMTYNAYSSASAQLTALRQENAKPLHSNVATWTPETGLDVYWVVVTAVDVQGHESAYSEAIQVIRHPQQPADQNSVGSKLLDKAGNALQKYIP